MRRAALKVIDQEYISSFFLFMEIGGELFCIHFSALWMFIFGKVWAKFLLCNWMGTIIYTAAYIYKMLPWSLPNPWLFISCM